MAMYTSYQIIDTPLTGEAEPLLVIRKRDLYLDPVQRRMLVILAFVTVMIAAFSVAILRAKVMAEPASLSIASTYGSVSAAPEELMAPALAPPLSPVFSPEVLHWSNEIAAWAAEYGLDPDIVATIMQIESCGDPQAISTAGAQGLFQVMPFHFQPGEDMLDPDTNARRGLGYYAQQLRETNGDVFLSFAGYNGGSGASSSSWDHWANETQRYYVWSKGIFQDAKGGLDSSPTLDKWMEAGGASLCRQASVRLGLR